MAEFNYTRLLDAPRERVFEVYTEARHLKHWWGPRGFELFSCAMDLRPGGTFHFGMRSPDGDEMWARWLFQEIVAPERLVVISTFADADGNVTRPPFAEEWPREILVGVEMSEQDGKTALRLWARAHNATPAEQQTFDAGFLSLQQGYSGTFDQLAEYLQR